MTPSDILDWESFFKDQGCTGITDYGDWINCYCVFHEQNDKIRPSFGIHKETGFGNCFSCGHHSWEDICRVFGISSENFIDGMKKNAWETLRDKIFKNDEKKMYKRFQLPKNDKMKYYVDGLPYVHERGIDLKTLNHFDIRICFDEESKYCKHILFPIYDEKGLLFFHARYIGDNKFKSRWIMPAGCAKWKTFFNWERVKDKRTLIFTEGATNVLKLWQFSFDAIAAKEFSPYQIKMILNSKVENIFLMYDKDEAGQKFTEKAKWLFGDSGRNVKVLGYPDYATDPAEVKSVNDLLEVNPQLVPYIDDFGI